MAPHHAGAYERIMSDSIQVGVIVAMLMVGLVALLRRYRQSQPPSEVCAVCSGMDHIDAMCETCKQPIHSECWDRHLCKYRIN